MERIYSLSLVLKEINNMSHNDKSEMVTQKWWLIMNLKMVTDQSRISFDRIEEFKIAFHPKK